ncbi:MAG: dicarboxylate transporter/tellurite-resistance protein TehA [Phenylobacterium sp.]|nr:dicarboxylate transporter/tellurite-resistance protein TehA [Phenylobacterium sp.]
MASSLPIPAVPASFFGMVLGLAGLATAWRAAHLAWGLPAAVGEALAVAAVAVWAIVLALYALKWLVGREAAEREAADPVQCCFIGLVGVATMLAAGAIAPYARSAAEILYVLGAAFTLAFAVWRTGALWRGGRDPATTTAVLYLPTVAGSFVCATVGATLGYQDWGQLFFGCGLFSWLAVESVLLHRLLTAPALADPLRPTLGIQLAPSVVGAVAYLSVTRGPPDVFAHALVGYGCLQALILLRLAPWIWRGAFNPGYWAFTFGATALATAPLEMVLRGDRGAIGVVAPVTFGLANLVVGFAAIGTLWLLVRGRLLPTAPRAVSPTGSMPPKAS